MGESDRGLKLALAALAAPAALFPLIELASRWLLGEPTPTWLLLVEVAATIVLTNIVFGYALLSWYRHRKARARGEDPLRAYWTPERLAVWRRRREGGFWRHMRSRRMVLPLILLAAYAWLLGLFSAWGPTLIVFCIALFFGSAAATWRELDRQLKKYEEPSTVEQTGL